MSLAPQELENSASKYAAEAIRLDSQGSRGMAIQSYQHAIEALVKLVQIYPEYKLNKDLYGKGKCISKQNQGITNVTWS